MPKMTKFPLTNMDDNKLSSINSMIDDVLRNPGRYPHGGKVYIKLELEQGKWSEMIPKYIKARMKLFGWSEDQVDVNFYPEAALLKIEVEFGELSAKPLISLVDLETMEHHIDQAIGSKNIHSNTVNVEMDYFVPMMNRDLENYLNRLYRMFLCQLVSWHPDSINLWLEY